MEFFVTLLQHLKDTALNGARGLVLPAVVFFLFSALFHKQKLLEVIRRVLPETRLNISVYIFDILVVLPLLVFPLTLISNFVSATSISLVSSTVWSTQNVLVVTVGVVFFGDLIGYWRHRMEHSRLLWPSHLLHHSDTEMTWFSLNRFHPINRLTTTCIDMTFLALLGFPDWALFTNSVVRHYYGYFIHADISWSYGPLAWIFVSPTMHRWHHVRDVKRSGRNFATVFSVFDRTFGTYYVPGACEEPLGVSHPPAPGLIPNLLHPFRSWGKQLYKKAR